MCLRGTETLGNTLYGTTEDGTLYSIVVPEPLLVSLSPLAAIMIRRR
jgi:hypothetical protein